MFGKWSVLPTSDILMRFCSLNTVPEAIQGRIMYILSVPFGATLVVFTRLFLGIRLFGPFRSILIAVALQFTGIIPGLLFLIIIIAIVATIRPAIRNMRLPYFARVSVILSTVASFMLLAFMVGTWMGYELLERMTYFPIVVLCLMGDRFSRTLNKEGLHSALWRAGMTVLLAIVITSLFSLHAFQRIFLQFPELLILEIGLMITMAEYADLRLLAWINPPVTQKEKRRSVRRAQHAEIGLKRASL